MTLTLTIIKLRPLKTSISHQMGPEEVVLGSSSVTWLEDTFDMNLDIAVCSKDPSSNLHPQSPFTLTQIFSHYAKTIIVKKFKHIWSWSFFHCVSVSLKCVRVKQHWPALFSWRCSVPVTRDRAFCPWNHVSSANSVKWRQILPVLIHYYLP